MEIVFISCLFFWFFGAKFWDVFKIFAAFVAAVSLVYFLYSVFLYFSFKSLFDYLVSLF